MRKLNEQEVEVLSTYQKRHTIKATPKKKLKVEYKINENMTIAVVGTRKNIFYGWAKFNPNDPKFIPEVGKQIAFYRAIKQL